MHIKRLLAPRTWNIRRKGIKFATKPSPGKHTIKSSMPINIVLRDILKIAKTTRDVKMIISEGEIFADAKPVTNYRLPVGLMDVIEFPKSGESFRILINKKGLLAAAKITGAEQSLKPLKIKGKNLLSKGRIQLNFHDGTNMIADKKDYSTGDTIIFDIKAKKPKGHIKLEKGSYAYLTGGKHIGHSGAINEVTKDKITIKPEKGDAFETLKEYGFAVGKGKPEITLI